MGRGLVALAAFLIPAGASFFVLLRLCERCGQDNAYLLEVLLGVVTLVTGVGCGLLWLLASRRDGPRALVIGGIQGLVVGAAIAAVGASRMLVPPALTVLELFLLLTGVAVVLVLGLAGGRGGSRAGA